MPGLIGKKLGMTNYYTADGRMLPVTVIEAGPCTVVQIKTADKDGYTALQLGYGSKKNVNKPESGHLKKVNLESASVLKEFRNFDISGFSQGDKVTVELFKAGDKVKVSSKSKGRGFQGVVKRHGFSGVGGTSHGQHDRERAPGSIGSSSYPSRVFKGMKMAGRMGYDNFTVRNLQVVNVIPEKNIVLVKGAVPGAANSIVEINI
ncbi:MAG: 50S ribosomal protein L3 [Ignavibacteriales bacterium]|nr:50S ribosomal protein L3 [Ignavibacteriales bacterium]MCF8315704.1 50S ribosomal protein L3 [Ignavibacteriales bacterium]MCF8437102.1 50S ribosomal protein L3 [Ignavibacteriales bacterium]